MNEPQTFADLQDAGNAQAQLILQAIARHADWDTGQCWPGDEALARMAKCSTRTVQTYLSRLEADGLIAREDRRSVRGTKMTRMITLVGYSQWISTLRNGGNVSKPKAVGKYEQPPESLSGGPPENPAVTTGKLSSVTTGKQVAGQEHSLNNQLNKSARAREVDNFGLGSEGAKPSPSLPVFTIQPADTSWNAWLEHFRQADQADLAFDATQKRRIRASSRWPQANSVVFEPKPRKPLSKASKRMTGDAA